MQVFLIIILVIFILFIAMIALLFSLLGRFKKPMLYAIAAWLAFRFFKNNATVQKWLNNAETKITSDKNDQKSEPSATSKKIINI
jgi:hypothetical protein